MDYKISDLVWCKPLNEKPTIGVITKINNIGFLSYEVYELATTSFYGWTNSISIIKLNKL